MAKYSGEVELQMVSLSTKYGMGMTSPHDIFLGTGICFAPAGACGYIDLTALRFVLRINTLTPPVPFDLLFLRFSLLESRQYSSLVDLANFPRSSPILIATKRRKQ
jgi:hypothetical protein